MKAKYKAYKANKLLTSFDATEAVIIIILDSRCVYILIIL